MVRVSRVRAETLPVRALALRGWSPAALISIDPWPRATCARATACARAACARRRASSSPSTSSA
eukprot:5507637-Alexandrium_andersonii.AAC.1